MSTKSINIPIKVFDEFSAGLKKFEKAVNGQASHLNKSIDKTAKRAQGKVSQFKSYFSAQMASMGVMGFAKGIARLGAQVVGEVSKLQKEQVNVTKTTGMSDAAIKKLTDSFVKFSNVTGTSRTKMMELAESAGRMGIKGAGEIEKFARTFTKLEVATDITSEMSEEVVRLFKTIGEDIGNVDLFSNAITDLGNNTASSESRILDFATRLSGASNYLNLSTDELLGLASGLAETSNQSELAGTAFQMLAGKMSQASFGDKSVNMFAQVTGMTAEEFQKTFKEDGKGALLSFLKGVQKLQAGGGNVSAIFQGIGLEGQRAGKAILDLAKNADTLPDLFKRSADGMTNLNAINGEFNNQVNTSGQQLARVGEAWHNMLAKAMDSKELTIVLKSIADTLTRVNGNGASAFGTIIAGVLRASALISKAVVTTYGVLQMTVTAIVAGIMIAGQTIWSIINGAIKSIKLDFLTIKKVASGVWNVIAGVAQLAFGKIKKGFIKVVNGVLAAYNWVVGKFGKEGVELIDLSKTDKNLNAAKERVKKGAKDIVAAMKDNLTGRVDILKDTGKEIADNAVLNTKALGMAIMPQMEMIHSVWDNKEVKQDGGEKFGAKTENEVYGPPVADEGTAVDDIKDDLNGAADDSNVIKDNMNDASSSAINLANSLKSKVEARLNDIRGARESNLSKGGKKRLERVNRDIDRAKAAGNFEDVEKFEARRDRILGMDKFNEAGERALAKGGQMAETGGQMTETGKKGKKKKGITEKLEKVGKEAINKADAGIEKVVNVIKELAEKVESLGEKVEAIAE